MKTYRKCFKLRFHSILVVLFTIMFALLFKQWAETLVNTRIHRKSKNSEVINNNPREDVSSVQNKMNREFESILEDLVLQENGTGCEIPILNPFSKEARKYDETFKKIICDSEEWVECFHSECYLKKTILDRMGHVFCNYRDIIYVNDDYYYLGEPVLVEDGGTYFLNISDYVRISCIAKYKSQILRWNGHKAGFRPIASVTKYANQVNVFLLILDSTSRNTFVRRMPISYRVLTKDLGAVVMNSYNIVGESTAGSMFPILTGHNEFELPFCRKMPGNTERVDPKPFIFTLLGKYGYETAFFEDMPWFHTFNYRYGGFEKMLANHYMRPLFQGITWRNNKVWTDKKRYCFGSELLFKFMIDYSAKLFDTTTKKFCVTITGTFSHDNLNPLTNVDNDLAYFLRKFKLDGHLKDTALFVMSDHGSRNTAIRNTYQGKIEELLPFVSVVLPKRLQEVRPGALQTLKENSKILTTPYDVHTTILDILGLKQHRNKYKVPGASLERGLSFLDSIPSSRSCGEAGILPHYCACARWHSVSPNDIIYTKVSLELVRFINKMTAQERYRCAERDLLSIVSVFTLRPMMDFVDIHRLTSLNVNVSSRRDGNQHDPLKPRREYYQSKIVMGPNEAIFEGSLQYDSEKNTFRISNTDVSRVGVYRDESRCVSETQPHLNKYCHCSRRRSRNRINLKTSRFNMINLSTKRKRRW